MSCTIALPSVFDRCSIRFEFCDECQHVQGPSGQLAPAVGVCPVCGGVLGVSFQNDAEIQVSNMTMMRFLEASGLDPDFEKHGYCGRIGVGDALWAALRMKHEGIYQLAGNGLALQEEIGTPVSLEWCH